jgi:hypothetical protein
MGEVLPRLPLPAMVVLAVYAGMNKAAAMGDATVEDAMVDLFGARHQ